jgi:hypothetical protein
MTREEFEALLKIQDRYLLMCKVIVGIHADRQELYAADVVNKRNYVVMDGNPTKTERGAVQSSIAKYYRQNANNK